MPQSTLMSGSAMTPPTQVCSSSLSAAEEFLVFARITDDYRALGEVRPDEIVWFWIGPHHEYDKLIRSG
jgi:hypothetical protein